MTVAPLIKLDTVQDYKTLLWLVANDYVYLYPASNNEADETSPVKDQHLRFSIDVSGAFYYASSEYHEFDIQDTAELKEMLELFGSTGLVAWCARDKCETPLNELITEQYLKAYEYAAKFYEPDYDYFLLVKEPQYETLVHILGGKDFTAHKIDVAASHWAVRVRLTLKEFNDLYRYTTSIYRYYGGYRVKECKFRYFNGYSVNSTRQVVAGLLGFHYDYNRSFEPVPASDGV